MKLSGEQLESLYTTMVRIRRFDEKTAELFQAGLVKGTAHSYVGEEAVAAGACASLREGDYIVGTHRGHGHCIAKGARLDLMMAELMGRQDGYCRGLGGSMHIAALDLHILGCNGIVAAGLPIGTGAALAEKIRKTDHVVIAFFGDGGANQGVVHEAMNLAAVWALPIVFLCENNQYALSTASKRTTAGPSIAARAAGYDIPGARVVTMAEALNEALHGEMQRDARVFVMGEDVGLIGGIFGVTRGLREKFGEDRVRDTPISEATFLGAGVGAAIAGLRPVVEIQIFDFVAMTMDQIVNQAAKFRYMLGGPPTVPLVIRGPPRGGIRLAAPHPHSLETWH